jgi:D-tyrosyl-tRNA(Tyr) deacylase
MRALIQRVKKAKVEVDEKIIGEIGNGLLIFLGVAHSDADKDIDYLVKKITDIRIFGDVDGKMNLSILDVKGSVLIISQFTLYADCANGRRPSFTKAAAPATAEFLYKKFIQKFRQTGIDVQDGKFGAMMDISLVNWGPVTIMMESPDHTLFP